MLKIKRAHEERTRLNIEVQRLITAMRDEETDITSSIHNLEGTDDLLVAELQDILARRLRMNDMHRSWIEAIYSLKCYTGSREAGTRIRRVPTTPPNCDDSEMSMATDNVEVNADGLDGSAAPDEDDSAADKLD